MNKKYAIVSIVLIALMSLSLTSSVKAFDTGPGSPNTNYNAWGPRPSTLLMKVYSGFASEFSDFQGGALDFEDEILTPAQYSAISSNPTFTTGFVPQYSLREYDLNDYVAPFNNTYYRQGVTFLINRPYFINSFSALAGAATPAYSPIACDAPYYNATAMAALYPPSNSSAYVAFMQSPFTLIPDPTDPTHYCTWAFASPYTVAGPNGEPTVPDNQIEIFARTEQAERTAQGAYLQQVCQFGLPAWALANLGNSVFVTYPLPTNPSSPYPGHVLLPRVVVNVYDYKRSVCATYVMSDYDFMVYTGGWSLSSTPDFLQFYTYTYAPANLGFAPGVHNYGSCEMQNGAQGATGHGDTFLTDVNNLLASPQPGTNGLPVGSGSYWAYICQQILMGDAALIPMWYYSGYSAMLSATYNGINAYGVGFNNWWSFFDAYKSGGTGYGDTIKYGWSSDVENMNPITSTWYWDWQILGEIYDSCVSGNPYIPSQINPGLADNYSVVANNPSINGGNSVVTVHLRGDVFFQDVPYKVRTAYTVDGGTELNGPFINRTVSVLDEAFNIEYLRDMDYWYGTDNGILIDDVDHVVISSMYNNTSPVYGWPFWNATAYPQGAPWFNSTDIQAECVAEGIPPITWQYNYVQFSPTLDANTIQLWLTDKLTWLAYFRDLAIPIIPHYIFEWLATDSWSNAAYPGGCPMVETMDLTPWTGANLLYGTGPYVLTAGTTGVSYTMQAYVTGLGYGAGEPGTTALTTANSYFWAPNRVADRITISSDPMQIMWKAGDAADNFIKILQISSADNSAAHIETIYASLTPLWYTATGWVLGTTVQGTLMFWLGNWTPPPANTGTTLPVNFPAGSTVTLFYSFAVTIPAGALFMVPLDDWHIWIHGMGAGGDWGGSWTQGLMLDSNHWSAYASKTGIAIINMAALPADIASQTTPTAPYWGADGTVGSKDLHVLGVEWGNTVPAGTDPRSDLARADIGGFGSVGSKDLHILGVEWGKTWDTTVLPKNPIPPPPALLGYPPY